ncbi:MAG: hypothetical protein J6K17_06980 [Oscillospiraceae bacterium]|nr:hypothetical protein [Oscillospiraceae bacterium]
MNIRTAKQCEKLCDHLLEARNFCKQITRENSGMLNYDLAKAVYSAEKAIDIVHKQLYVAMCGAGNNNPLTF